MGYNYTIKTLVGVKKWFDNNPDGIIQVPGMWPEVRLNRIQWHEWFVGCLNDKINRNNARKWRKLDYDYQNEMRRAQRDLNYRGANGSKLFIRWLPKDLRARFEHRISTDY